LYEQEFDSADIDFVSILFYSRHVSIMPYGK
jgi:hypothetical protein